MEKELIDDCIKNLTDAERTMLEEQFRLFDRDNSGFITKKELVSVRWPCGALCFCS